MFDSSGWNVSVGNAGGNWQVNAGSGAYGGYYNPYGYNPNGTYGAVLQTTNPQTSQILMLVAVVAAAWILTR